ncbi:MAG TPA: hypothetical protein DEZ08_00890 [Dehalococcoidia bacterium]|nr:hypothetical protein [Dehalococcoidia bacterium]
MCTITQNLREVNLGFAVLEILQELLKMTKSILNYIHNNFSLDLRSLALFRIVVGVLLLWDLIWRMKDLTAHYSDLGLLPRAALTDTSIGVSGNFDFSIYMIVGHSYLVLALMLVHLLIALVFIFGFKTRLFTIILWLMTISLHARNPMILTGGDSLLSLLLFWSIFLPLGARYSIDKALNKGSFDASNSICNAATFAIMAQVVLVYVFNWIAKLDPIWVTEHTALYYALSLDMFTTSFGFYLLNFPTLLSYLTISVHMLQITGPLLLLWPWWNQLLRGIVIIAFIGFHLGIASTMHIGYFPYISIASLLIFVPAGFWDKICEYMAKRRETFIMYYDDGCDFCIKTVLLVRTFLFLTPIPLKPVQSNKEIFRLFKENNTWVVRRDNRQLLIKFEGLAYVFKQSVVFKLFGQILDTNFCMKIGTKFYEAISDNRSSFSPFTNKFKMNNYSLKLHRISTAIIIIMLGFVLYWNVANIKQMNINKPSWMSNVGEITRLKQKWSMFAPHPVKHDGWFVAAGTVAGNKTIDIFTELPVDYSKPQNVADTYPNNRWRKYLINIKKPSLESQRLYYGKYLCRNWYFNHSKEERLEDFQLYFMDEKTLEPELVQPINKQLIWNHDCFTKSE